MKSNPQIPGYILFFNDKDTFLLAGASRVDETESDISFYNEENEKVGWFLKGHIRGYVAHVEWVR